MTLPKGIRGWIVNALLKPELAHLARENETPLELIARHAEELKEMRIRATQVEASMLQTTNKLKEVSEKLKEIEGRSVEITSSMEYQIETNIKDQERVDLYHAGLANGLILANSLLKGKPAEFVKVGP